MPETAESTGFTLIGCREVCHQMGEPARIVKMIDILETAVVETPGLAFDAAKALVESVCKTVLVERAVEVDENWDVPKLVKNTLASISLAPDPYADEIGAVLRKLGGGLQSTATALGELRNKDGFISHGRDAYWRELDNIHAEVAARAAETLVYLIFMAHLRYPPEESKRDPIYSDYEEFNAYYDELVGPIQLADIEYSPSEVLWLVDRAVYRGLQSEYELSNGREQVSA